MFLVVRFPTRKIGGSTSEMTTEGDEGKGIFVVPVVKTPPRNSMGQFSMTTEDGRRRDFTRSPPNLRVKLTDFVTVLRQKI